MAPDRNERSPMGIEPEEEELHYLEKKYGKEPKIDPEDLWFWH